MQRRRFGREFKLEAVKLVREREVLAAQAARDLDVQKNVLRKWVKEFGSDRVQAFPDHDQQSPSSQWPNSGIVCSMSRPANVRDNAMESFLSSLKPERTARATYRTRNEAKADVFDYIERFYSEVRRHATIGISTR